MTSQQQVKVSGFTFEFPQLAPQLLIPVGVSAPFDTTNPPNPAPQIHQEQALWDTGASGCVITERLAKKLGLVSVGPGTATGISGPTACSRHIVNIFLPHGVVFEGIIVSDAAVEPPNFDIIIGMDVITQGDMALSHVGGKTLFSFRMPSIEKLDFKPKQTHVSVPTPKLGPNDPCHCGSHRKFKKCHGGRA